MTSNSTSYSMRTFIYWFFFSLEKLPLTYWLILQYIQIFVAIQQTLMRGLEMRNNLTKEAQQVSTLADLFLFCLLYLCVSVDLWHTAWFSPGLVWKIQSTSNKKIPKPKQVVHSFEIIYALHPHSRIITEVGLGQVSNCMKTILYLCSPSALCLVELSSIWWCLLPSSGNKLTF